jgi:hypothetical protein
MRFNLRHVILTLIFGSFALAATQSDLETAFEQNYEPSQSVVESAENAVFSLENANSAYLPRFTLSETLQAVNYQTVSLQASLGATWNILDAKRDLQRQISELQIKFANLEKTSDKDRARLNFRTYVQALNTYEYGIRMLRSLEADVKKQRPLWTVDTPASQFAPNEIDSYLKFLEFVDSRKSLEVQAERLRKQLGKWTKLSAAELAEGQITFPGDPSLESGIVVDSCVDQSVSMQQANMRLEQEKLYEALTNDASPILTVSGQVNATTAAATGQSAFSGQVSVSLNIPIPNTSVFSGNTQATAGLTGVTQTASVSFPNLLRQAEPQGAKWAEKNLADTREAITDQLNDSLRSRENLISNIKLAKQRLEWGERSLRDSSNADALAKLNARFALMGLKIRGYYDHLNLQINTLSLANTCKLKFNYAPRDAVFSPTKVP